MGTFSYTQGTLLMRITLPNSKRILVCILLDTNKDS